MADQYRIDFTVSPTVIDVGGVVELALKFEGPADKIKVIRWQIEPHNGTIADETKPTAFWYPDAARDYYEANVALEAKEDIVLDENGGSTRLAAGQQFRFTDWKKVTVNAAAGTVTSGPSPMPVTLTRTSQLPTLDQQLWTMIRNRTNAVAFRNYRPFIDDIMATPSYGPYAYELLKQATDAFLMQETGVVQGTQLAYWQQKHLDQPLDEGRARLDPNLEQQRLARLDGDEQRRLISDEARRLGYTPSLLGLKQMREAYYSQLEKEGAIVLPYFEIIRDRLADIPLKNGDDITGGTYGILRSWLTGPVAIELIWSYWHEEGMLVQTLNAILARFQNRRLVSGRDPLARFDLDPLRPLSNIFWGWAQDEMHRLTVRRRAYEYDHQYGLTLYGKAVPPIDSVDSRSKFLGAFHNLLHLTHIFYKEDDDTTVIADGFAVLNALREVHLLLAEGAHNQYGDLPSAARAEMLIMEWILARPEMREFLGGRIMVPYEETWMDRVDTVKTMYGWTDTTITHFRDLGVYGEQILLSVRYGNWSVVNDPQQAANWARYWRPEVQRYVHAYRAATGVDLTQRVDHLRPGVHLQRRVVARARAQ